MKHGLLLFFLIQFLSSALISQSEGSNIVHEVIEAKSISNNPGGEDASRHIAIYLPSKYTNTTSRYPVIYWAHGFGRTPGDSIFYEMKRWQKLLDKAIAENVISPIIMVFVDNTTHFWGSNYANSELTGNWKTSWLWRLLNI